MSERLTALITGASSGIGVEFARQLAERGHDLILIARRGDRLAALAAELQDRHGITAEPLVADLSTTGGVDKTAARLAELSNLALLVNNAGFGISGSLARAELQGQLDMLNVHVVAAMRLSHAALPGMIAVEQAASSTSRRWPRSWRCRAKSTTAPPKPTW